MELLIFLVFLGMTIGCVLIVSGFKASYKIDWIYILTGCLMIAFAMISISGFESADREANPNFVFICIVFIYIGYLIAFYHNILLHSKKIKERKMLLEEKKKEEELEIKRQKNIKAKELYLKIAENNNDINNDRIIEILANTYKLEKGELLDLYNKGKEVVQQEIKNEIEEKKQEEINQDLKKINIDKENTKNIGKNKYIMELEKAKANISSNAKLYEKFSIEYYKDSIREGKVKQTDYSLFAGMANGLAGPGAAIMVANDITQKNQLKKIQGEENAKKLNEISKYYSDKAEKERQLNRDILNKIEYYINAINGALIDENLEEICKLIHFKICNVGITDTNMIELKIKSELENIKIIDKEGIIDGSFCIKVFDSQEKIIAKGYFNGNNFSINNNSIDSNIGFRQEKNVLCEIIDNNLELEKDKFHFKIEPINIWIIEKKWDDYK